MATGLGLPNCLFGDDSMGPGLGERMDGMGEPAKLRRAWASRNAATEIRWEVSEEPLPFLGRGRAGGTSDDVESLGEGWEGEGDGPTCLNAFRLKAPSSDCADALALSCGEGFGNVFGEDLCQ